jgi:hypothetical protein
MPVTCAILAMIFSIASDAEVPGPVDSAPADQSLTALSALNAAGLADFTLDTFRPNPDRLELRVNLGGTPPESREGYFTLSWNLPATLEDTAAQEYRFLLLESNSPDLRNPTLFLDGQDTSIAMSGKVDGDFYYRVILLKKRPANKSPGDSHMEQDQQGLSADTIALIQEMAGTGGPGSGFAVFQISNTLHIHVEHYSLITAFSYFGAGAFLFVFTGAVIIAGSRRSKGEFS